MYLAQLMYTLFYVNSLNALNNYKVVATIRPIFDLRSHVQKLKSTTAKFQPK